MALKCSSLLKKALNGVTLSVGQSREGGRSSRGKRLKGDTRFGKWHTQTFISGLRCDRLIAAQFVSGAMKREASET